MRNSSLVERLRAEDLPGLSMIPKLRILDLSKVVGERSMWGEAVPKGACGPHGSENAGVSNDNG